MRSSKLVDVFKSGNIVIPLFLLKNYKKFEVSIDEFIFLMYLYNLGDKFLFNPGKFGFDLNMDLKDVMCYISSLTDKGFIKVEVLRNEKGLMEEFVLLDDFYNKITLFTIDAVNSEEDDVDSNIFELIEKEFGRTLSPIEYEIIKAWLENKMSEDLIKEAIKEATFNGVSNLRYIDKILYEWGKLGVSSVKDVDEIRRKRNMQKDSESDDVDMDIVDWNWFDDDE